MKDTHLTDPHQPLVSHFKRTDIRKQRFLIFSSLFPPDALGGAEISAYNLALWLVKQGAEVAVLTTAKTPTEARERQEIEGLKIWRLWMPRAYPMYYASQAKWWRKPLWHLQDHVDPRNREVARRIIEAFKPDFIHIHLIQGLGYNMLLDVAKCSVPTTFFLHDLGLVCVRMGMFKKGRSCVKQCGLCKVSSVSKLGWVKKIKSLCFVSPSLSNLTILGKYFPLTLWPSAVIKNVNRIEPPTVARKESDHLRILYVGRLHATKGIELLLEAAQNLAAKYNFTLTIAGAGPDEGALHQKYAQHSWCTFVGFVTQQEVSNYIVNSDVLCVPSIWAENSPGVIIHALSLGLPVMGSNNGGIPELIEDHKNGLLVVPGDKQAWQNALEQVLLDRSILMPWRNYAMENAHQFDQDYLGNKLLEFTQNQPRLTKP